MQQGNTLRRKTHSIRVAACAIVVFVVLTGCRSNTAGVDITNRSPWPVRLRITDISQGAGITARRPAQTVEQNTTFAEVFEVTDPHFVERQYMMDVPGRSDTGMVVLRAAKGRIVRRDLAEEKFRLIDRPSKAGTSEMFKLALEALKQEQKKKTLAVEPVEQ